MHECVQARTLDAMNKLDAEEMSNKRKQQEREEQIRASMSKEERKAELAEKRRQQREDAWNLVNALHVALMPTVLTSYSFATAFYVWMLHFAKFNDWQPKDCLILVWLSKTSLAGNII
jgi:flagellar biosynthesis protein FliP